MTKNAATYCRRIQAVLEVLLMRTKFMAFSDHVMFTLNHYTLPQYSVFRPSSQKYVIKCMHVET